MDVTEAVETRLEVRDYADRAVEDEIKRAILDAARLAPSGKNLQHWRFVLVDDPDDVSLLADESPTGRWVGGADFAVLVCTDPGYAYHEIDAGRAATHMQLVAWEHDVGSCLYTGVTDAARAHFGIPDDRDVTAIVAFGYPTEEIRGIKDREPLSAIASRGRYDGALGLE